VAQKTPPKACPRPKVGAWRSQIGATAGKTAGFLGNGSSAQVTANSDSLPV
jgi:hypothetical protein